MRQHDGSVRAEYPTLRPEDYFTPEELKLISAFIDLSESGAIGRLEAIVLVEGIETEHEAR